MNPIDRVVLGDNQFFGINHMSQDKAQNQAERFSNLQAILDVYEIAIDEGVRAIMLNSNARAGEICDAFRANANRHSGIAWYPSIPYPHKYANLVSEKGIVATLSHVLFDRSSSAGALNLIAKGGSAILGKDAVRMMQLLVDLEMKPFRDLNVRVVFLQNVITDLLLGLGLRVMFEEYCDYIRRRYGVLPGLITQNMPFLKRKLEEWGITDIVICASFNEIGYLMSPDVEAYISCATANDPSRYQLMAMSTLASGAIAPARAYRFINRQSIQSVVFGASSRGHIRESVALIGTPRPGSYALD
jgi:hypothetical protein